MLIAQIKGKKLCIDSAKLPLKESCNCVFLKNIDEFLSLYNQNPTGWRTVMHKNDLYTALTIGLQHVVEDLFNKHNTQNISEGTSKLIRLDQQGVIKIAFRNSLDETKNYRNSICIDNQTREMFFADTKRTSTFNPDKPCYCITRKDTELYNKWSEYIDTMQF